MIRSKRSPNFTKAENDLLMQLIEKHREILECRNFGKVYNRKKEEAWLQIAYEYNINSDPYRRVDTLKKRYENLKKEIKKKSIENDFNVQLLKSVDGTNLSPENKESNYTVKVEDIEGDGIVEEEQNCADLPILEATQVNLPELKNPSRPEDEVFELNNEDSNYTLIDKEYDFKTQFMRQEHEEKMIILRRESEAKLRYLASEHNIKMEILKTELMIKQKQLAKM